MTAGAPPAVTLLGFTVEDAMMREVLRREPTMPVQTHAFAWAVLDALRVAECRTTVLSVPPVSTYPRYPQLVFRGGAVAQDTVDGALIPFVNLPLVRHATRFVGGCLTGLPALRRWRSTVLLVHGVHSPFLWLGVLARAATGTRIVAVLTDAPGVRLPGEPRVLTALRRLDVAVVRAALRRYDGVVTVTEDLARDFAPGRRSMLMEGIIGRPEGRPGSRPVRPAPAVKPPRATFDIVYAGGLSRDYGVDRLVDAVRGMPDPDVRLLLFGRGRLDPWLHRQAAADPRIVAPEFVPRESLPDRLRTARVLVNPRPVDGDLARYGFPSKLLEYLDTGVPVVTTALPCIPDAYRAGMVFAEADTAAGLAAAIARVRALPDADAGAIGAKGRELLRDRCGPARQGQRLRRFFEELAATR
ncbi:glycosyltransferase [Dactylosporangium sp. NBC_01737]|uniref:glycosyltransferase n=1 Tax=Dactylosporangium sp. NBC_01737 TaxID=2975959 RepID=UPI002E1475E5|nr:glycosyltransferase [Dactylosporangium sp. NBC_01737]